MTAMGKMLVFMVLVLSLIWNGLVMNAYVTRTNWRAEAKKAQDKALEAAEAANKQKILLEMERESIEDTKRALRAESDRLYSLKALLEDERIKLITAFNAEFSDEQKKAVEIAKLQANVQRLQAQVNDQDKAILAKEKELDGALIERDAAKVSATKANLESVAQKERADRFQIKIQELNDRIADLERRSGGSGGGIARGGPLPPAVPDQLRGTVVNESRSSGDSLVTISVGTDHGVQLGSELKVSRIKPVPAYLGKLVIIRVDLKQAVGRFVPPPGKRLTENDMPRAGDEVTPNK